jgi:hypothetical protein
MQPGPPSAPNSPYGTPKPRNSSGSGAIFGVIVLLAVVYLVDHATKGEAGVFSAVDRHISAQDFHNAQCIAVFGACKIDLRDAQIQGREAVVDAFAIFGGVEIWVPEDWVVVSRGVTLFGGNNDQRRHAPGGANAKTLILQGATIFGGTAVRN